MSAEALAPARAPTSYSRYARHLDITDFIVAIVVIGAVVVGLYYRLWLIFHAPSSSDADVVGLMAQAALHGHFTAFYGGQAYGGTAEPDLIALAFFGGIKGRLLGTGGLRSAVQTTLIGGAAAAAAYGLAHLLNHG